MEHVPCGVQQIKEDLDIFKRMLSSRTQILIFSHTFFILRRIWWQAL